jgi:hypothetical protein
MSSEETDAESGRTVPNDFIDYARKKQELASLMDELKREERLNGLYPEWREHIKPAELRSMSPATFERLLTGLERRLWSAASRALVEARFGAPR